MPSVKTIMAGALVLQVLLAVSAAFGQENEPCDNRYCFGIDWKRPQIGDVLELDLSEYQGVPVTPFHYAVRNCTSKSLLYMLEEKGADVNEKDGSTGLAPLQTAIILCRAEQVKALLQLGADPDEKDSLESNTLHTAIRRNRADDTIRALMASPVELDQRNNRGDTPLIMLLKKERRQLALELLDAGADPGIADKDKTAPAHLAAAQGDLELLRRLLFYDADFNTRNEAGQTPLHFAANRGVDPKTAAVFALSDADINVQDEQGLTPLHYAAASKSGQEVAALLVLKADPNHYDLVGDTPFHYAVEFNQDAQAVLALLRLGANPNLPNADGTLPMFLLATSPNSVSKLEILLSFGAELEVTDSNGDYPLHHAMRTGNAELVADLLEFGADPELEDRKGRSALDLYEERGIGEPAQSKLRILLHNRNVLREQNLADARERQERVGQRREARQEERRVKKEAREQQKEEARLQEELAEALPGLDALEKPGSSGDQNKQSQKPQDLDSQLEELGASEQTIRELLQIIQSEAQKRTEN